MSLRGERALDVLLAVEATDDTDGVCVCRERVVGDGEALCWGKKRFGVLSDAEGERGARWWCGGCAAVGDRGDDGWWGRRGGVHFAAV